MKLRYDSSRQTGKYRVVMQHPLRKRRVELYVMSLHEQQDTWIVVAMAGEPGCWPDRIKAQGPYAGPPAALAIKNGIVQSLLERDYILLPEAQLIWQLKAAAERRLIDRESRQFQGNYEFDPSPG